MAADKQKKIPGPDHPISIEVSPFHVVVTVGGKIIADTHNAKPHIQLVNIFLAAMSIWPGSYALNIRVSALTRAMPPITAFPPAVIDPSMRFGPMRRHLKRWRR
jgi:hypothetical protein